MTKHYALSKPKLGRVFIDMDGVIVDFEAHMVATGLAGDELKKIDGAYLAMPAVPGALEAVRSIIGMGFDVWIATKPPTGIAYAYRDKAQWILDHLPELKRKIIVTHDKGLLGDSGDILIDDRPHKANCEQFKGHLIVFKDGQRWPEVLSILRERAAGRALLAKSELKQEPVDIEALTNTIFSAIDVMVMGTRDVKGAIRRVLNEHRITSVQLMVEHDINCNAVSMYSPDIECDCGAEAAAKSKQIAPMPQIPDDVLKDAERYRWLRDKNNDVALVLDKRTDWVAPDEAVEGVGGYWMYEYRADEELDAAIDAAISGGKGK